MGVETAQRPAHTTRQRVSSGDNQSAHSRVPTEDELTSLFDAAMKRSASMDASSETHKAPSMTPDEQQKFLKAMQDEQFRSLLNDYMQEISDPTNRAETEQYLAQLEREQKVPSDKLLIKPTPGFVIKTKWLTSHKIFVNICSSDKLQPPSSTKVEGKGTSWSLPYSVGPERLEKDKSGGSVTTFDVCFHPRTLQFATLQKPYRDMVATTCLDALEPLLRKAQKKPNGELSRDYHVLKGVLYKSGEPVTMCLTKPKETVETVEEVGEKQTKIETLEPTRVVEDEMKTPASIRPNSVEEARQEEATPLIREVSSTKLTKEPAAVRALPKLVFRVIYRGRFEMMDHMQATLQVDPSKPVELPNRPKELVVEIEFPTFSSAKGIDLDVNDTAVQVKAEGYEPLEVKLPFAVVEAKGSAKFDKKARKLVVTLPVQPPAPVEVKRMAIVEHDDEEEDQEEQTTEEQRPPVASLRNPVEEVSAVQRNQEAEASQEESKAPQTEQEALFARLRETAMMVANDPMYLPQPIKQDEPSKAETKTTTAAPPVKRTLDETVKQLVANDKTYDDLPPLESCSEDEDEGHNLKEDEAASAEQEGPVVESPSNLLVRQTPPFTIKETALCRSYLVEVAGVDAKSVELTFPSPHAFVLRCASPTTGYELRIDDLTDEIDTQRSESNVASENLVVILYKKTELAETMATLAPPPPVVRFQNDLLYELD